MTEPEMPDSPISGLLADAINMRELMMTWIEAGFTPDQAFQMIRDILCEQVRSLNRRDDA